VKLRRIYLRIAAGAGSLRLEVLIRIVTLPERELVNIKVDEINKVLGIAHE